MAGISMEEIAGERFASDPIICNCNNVCNRDSGRGACPCKQAGRKCSRFCTCGTKKLACKNRTQKRGKVDTDISSDDELQYSFIDDDDDMPTNTPSDGKEIRSKPSKQKAKKKTRKSDPTHPPSVEASHTDDIGEPNVESPQADDICEPAEESRASQPESPSEGNNSVNIEAFIQSKNEAEVRALCLDLLQRHPEDLQEIIALEIPGDNDPSDEDEDNNLDWCKCGQCRDMPTETENVCCRRRVGACVISNVHFHSLIVDPEALELAMAQRMDLLQLGDRPGNNAYRHAAYKSYIYWRCGPTGRHNRVVIPSCAVWKIRDRYPSEDGRYTGFRLNRF